ncbi:FkbM family methyltransferase [Bradyrhizobium sp. S69]|uniref:FkbM family methyltransferase n=1 Tax=Bradyrhizobium sp. S69 TaxID=1641856 RepID=UPI00131ABDB4|nr:FkbM family methyltransferase [Bradyrhizobium sp. S69]
MSRFVSYAQNYEDVILWRALGHVKDGFFVDCGAYDPTCHSVTKAFYDRGWRGINIEPIPSLLREFALQRPSDVNLNIALSDKSDYATFYEIVDTGLSTFSQQIANSHIEAGFEARSMIVQTATLSNVLEQFSQDAIHFLKIDVEGAEELVLAGLDLQKFRPWVILVEATKPRSGEPNHQDWESGLLSQGYDFVYFDGLNRFYVSHDHPELRLPLALPPNIFDNFVQIEQLDEVVRLQIQLATLKNSTSWRLTSPLREGKLFLRALRTHLRFIGMDLASRFRSRSTANSKPTGLGKLPKHVGGLAPSA